MKRVKVGAATLNQVPLDWAGNLERVRQAVSEARRQQVNILCLPELCMTGYGCEDAFLSLHTLDMAWRQLEALLPETGGMVVTVGLPVLFQKGVFNTACVIADGTILGFVAKQFLAGDGIHYEPRWFKPWSAGVVRMLERGGARFPIGDICFEVGGIRFGFEICEDAWVANRPGAALSLEGVDVILNPSASHFAFGKLAVRQRFVLEGSRAFGVSYVYANLVGNESGRAIYDGGAMIATGGRLVVLGPRFSFRDVDIISAVVDVDAGRMAQACKASFQPSISEEGQGPTVIRGNCDFAPIAPAPAAPPPPSLQEGWGDDAKAEEFIRAEALGLFDYLRKSRLNGFLISLSGGADSAACAVLVSLMVSLGVRELGLDGFKRKLDYIPAVTAAGDEEAVRAALLTTVFQPSENSGPVTREAARAIATALNSRHYVFDIAPIVKAYVGMVEKAVGIGLDWESDDVALQNVQARVRSPGAWLLANIRGALFLSTSNRSEAAVGYATMDGDTSGGLSPLAGIDKAWLRQWLLWMERTGPRGIGAIPALGIINRQEPTAELRPQAQTDEGDLMPYPLLDAVERAAIRDKQPPITVFELMRGAFPHYSTAQLHTWVARFFRLWSRNQWKRERYAPSFHLDDENLDPKTWCRWPILSGGFEFELRELDAYVAALAAVPRVSN